MLVRGAEAAAMNRFSTVELSEHLSDILLRVVERGKRFVIERDGEPIALLGPPDTANGTGPRNAPDL
jgi:hypothetical protein